MRIIKKISTIMSATILAICCGAYLLFGTSFTGWKALAIPTGSMRPSISSGSLVLMHSVPTSSLKVGDVITYISPYNSKETISHRIVKTYLIGGKIPGFVTKGDANRTEDLPVAAGNVLGKVIWHVPNIGSWLIVAKNPIVTLSIVYSAAILLSAEEIIRLSDYLKQNQPYKLHASKKKSRFTKKSKLMLASSFSMIFIFTVALYQSQVLALIHSNTVTLSNNIISTGNICAANRYFVGAGPISVDGQSVEFNAPKQPKSAEWQITVWDQGTIIPNGRIVGPPGQQLSVLLPQTGCRFQVDVRNLSIWDQAIVYSGHVF